MKRSAADTKKNLEVNQDSVLINIKQQYNWDLKEFTILLMDIILHSWKITKDHTTGRLRSTCIQISPCFGLAKTEFHFNNTENIFQPFYTSL